MKPVSVDICICTFRRTHVADTLRSIAQLQLQPGWRVQVIVADNDDTPIARELVETTGKELNLNLTYVHAPARNISIARNACLNKVTSDLVAYIDDDELASPEWFEAMIASYEKTNADVILGPVRAFYDSSCPEWMRKGDFHSTKPVWVNERIITGYTCNVMFNRTAKSIAGLRFRVDLGRTGGEDSVFFTTIYKAGGKIAYSPDALVTETVPANRASLGWLFKRRYRYGQTHGLLLREELGTGIQQRVKNLVIASSKALFSYVMALANAIKTERMHFWLLRGALHTGVASRLLGSKIIEPYAK